jgi:hypothetical protein
MGRSGQRSFTSHARSMLHYSAQPYVCENHINVPPTHQHNGKRGFGTFTLDGFQLLVFEQRRRQAAQVGVVLDDQYGSALR